MNADLFAASSGPSATGGIVEPARRPPSPEPPPGSGERFELRERSTGVIHQADTFAQMAAKAEQLGSALFVAVAADGKRTSIKKVDGQWQRGPQRPPSTPTAAALVRPVEPAHPAVAAPTTVLPASAAPSTPSAPEDAKPRTRPEAKAEQAQLTAKLEAALAERYIIQPAPVNIGALSIGRTEYRYRGDRSRVAFTESNLRLATQTNHPSVARSMVDVAQARGWRSVRVSGHEDFKRLIWLEATVRGLRTLGYDPSPQDLARLAHEREARLANRIEPAPVSAPASTEQGSSRVGEGRSAVLAAVEAVLVAQKVPEHHRIAVMAAATERLSQLKSQGVVPRVKIYDAAAPSRADAMPPPAMPAPAMTRTPERVAAAR